MTSFDFYISYQCLVHLGYWALQMWKTQLMKVMNLLKNQNLSITQVNIVASGSVVEVSSVKS